MPGPPCSPSSLIWVEAHIWGKGPFPASRNTSYKPSLAQCLEALLRGNLHSRDLGVCTLGVPQSLIVLCPCSGAEVAPCSVTSCSSWRTQAAGHHAQLASAVRLF